MVPEFSQKHFNRLDLLLRRSSVLRIKNGGIRWKWQGRNIGNQTRTRPPTAYNQTMNDTVHIFDSKVVVCAGLPIGSFKDVRGSPPDKENRPHQVTYRRYVIYIMISVTPSLEFGEKIKITRFRCTPQTACNPAESKNAY